MDKGIVDYFPLEPKWWILGLIWPLPRNIISHDTFFFISSSVKPTLQIEQIYKIKNIQISVVEWGTLCLVDSWMRGEGVMANRYSRMYLSLAHHVLLFASHT